MNKTILLINPNRMKPPVAPLGLEYVAGGLCAAGFEPVLCDLSFAANWKETVTAAVGTTRPAAIGVTVRNIDDAYFASQDFILEKTTCIIQFLKSLADAPVVLGGVGFSCAPREILQFTGADYGIAGEGEDAFPALLACIGKQGDPATVPGAVYRNESGVDCVPPALRDLSNAPASTRLFLDNRRYFAEGGQAGIETQRGCPRTCIYCVDPVAHGRVLRLRPPNLVVDECRRLLEQGVDVFHLCDTEFNLDRDHVLAVCSAFGARGIASRIGWYVYASPVPFDREMAVAMARAGCHGINFGADHADTNILRRLGRRYGPEDIARTAAACKDAGIAVMFDMLLGGPGETRETIEHAIGFMRKIQPNRVGLSCGIRVYPHTPMAALVRKGGPLAANPNLHGAVHGNDDLLRPVFFLEKDVGLGMFDFIDSMVKGDNCFLHANPNQIDGNYNYNDNSILSKAIAGGARGAYWDILSKLDTV